MLTIANRTGGASLSGEGSREGGWECREGALAEENKSMKTPQIRRKLCNETLMFDGLWSHYDISIPCTHLTF